MTRRSARTTPALRHDPLNFQLRLQTGPAAGEARPAPRRALHVRGDPLRRPLRRGPRRQESAETWQQLLAANYRRIVLLGGPALAHQWCRVDNLDNCERNAQRARLRERLRLELEDGLAGVTGPHGRDRRRRAPETGRSATLDAERVERELREVFALYALSQLVEARKCHARAKERWRRGGSAARDRGRARPDRRLHRGPPAVAAGAARPGTDALDLEPTMTSSASREDIAPHRSGMCRWHEHYTAACAFALPLLVEMDDPDGDCLRVCDRLAERAIARAQAGDRLRGQRIHRVAGGLAADRGPRPRRPASAAALQGLRGATYLPSGDATPGPAAEPAAPPDDALHGPAAGRRRAPLRAALAQPQARTWPMRASGGARRRACGRWSRARRRTTVTGARGSSCSTRSTSSSLQNGHEPLDVAFRRYGEPAPDGGRRDPDKGAQAHDQALAEAARQGRASWSRPVSRSRPRSTSGSTPCAPRRPRRSTWRRPPPCTRELWESLADWLAIDDKRRCRTPASASRPSSSAPRRTWPAAGAAARR